MKRLFKMLFAVLGCAFLSTSCVLSSPEKRIDKEGKEILSIGFFPNLTHIHALVAQAMTHQGKGWLERYLPQNVKIEWHRFNAGPSAMQNLIARIVDVSYVGPSPALNLYNRTKGRDCRLLAGAVKGGSGLVLQKGFKAKNVESWGNKRIATPQYGNTQDIACRAWFKKKDIQNVRLLPTSNPDQLTLFKKQQIDGAWTIEPWLSRLINESEGKIYLTDDDSWTTILVGSANFCEKFSSLKTQLIQAHRDLSLWIKEHPEETATLVQSEMKRQTMLDFPLECIKNTLQRIHIETDVTFESLQKWVDEACSVGFLKRENIIPLDGFMQEMAKGEAVRMSQNTAKTEKVTVGKAKSDNESSEKHKNLKQTSEEVAIISQD